MHRHKFKMKVLFFGRHECDASKKILSLIQKEGFDVTYIQSKTRGEKIPEYAYEWEGDYIICFRTLYILPDALLTKARIAAINFHPAPPEYPGSGCINFALYDEVDTYGVTAHLMNKEIDNGKILEVRRFPVNKHDNLTIVLKRTHQELHKLCSDFISKLASEGDRFVMSKLAEYKDVNWVGKARLMRELNELQTIDVDIEKSELERIIRSTYIDGFPPKIKIHGYEFYLNLDD